MQTMIRQLTRGPRHHFFGYYGICPWNATGAYHLALETDFHDRVPGPDDVAGVGVIECESGRFRRMAETRAFNLQQGSMLHWIDVGGAEEFTFNDWDGERLVSRAVDPESGDRRTLDGAIAAVSPSEPVAIGINYARTYACRRVTGYANRVVSSAALEVAPAGDGLFRIDLRSGQAGLLLSLAEIERAHPCRQAEGQPRWIEHVVYNTDGTRVIFLCRVAQANRRFLDSLWLIDADGRNLQCLVEYGHFISHFAWFTPDQVMVSCDVFGQIGFVTLDVVRRTMNSMSVDRFPPDGHNAFSPDFRWVVCDTYPQGADRLCSLLLHDRLSRQTHILGSFPHAEQYTGDCRCDLHPRWSKDGRRISFDSVHEGDRQIYEADVTRLQTRASLDQEPIR